MLKNFLVASTLLAFVATPGAADARTHKHHHHHTKLEKQIRDLIAPVAGGAGGYAVGGPLGAAVGAGAGYLATHKFPKSQTHRKTTSTIPAYPGFTYRDGYYYDRDGHYFTLEQMINHYGVSSYRQRTSAHTSRLDHGTGVPPYKFAEKYGVFKYPGFTYRDGVYWDQAGNWYAPSYMYRYYGPSNYQDQK